MRDAPLAREQRARLHGEPVVRVHEVVGAALGAGEGGDAAREQPGERLQLFLLKALRAAGVDVHQAHAGGDRQHLALERIGAAGEDVDFDAVAPEPVGDLAHVDVHPAALASAERRERRGVEGEHGKPLWGEH